MATAKCGLFQAGDLACVIGDDSDHGSGSTQYSGLWTLISRHFVHTAFTPPYAGFIAGTHRGTRPAFSRINDTSARLYRSPTEESQIESEAVFIIRPPHYIDYNYSFVLTGEPISSPLNGCLELSWCNYMNAVTDPAIYFVSNGKWVREYSTTHGYKAMHYPSQLSAKDRERRPVEIYERQEKPIPFHWSASETTFDIPLYYGRVHRMIFLVMFEGYLDWRFFMSPTGGGGNALGPGHHNPAWDWSWIIRGPEVGKRYNCHIRLAYKPFLSNQDVLTEYLKWKHSDHSLLKDLEMGPT